MTALTDTERSLVEQTMDRPATTPRQREVRRILEGVLDRESLRRATRKIAHADDVEESMDT